MEKFRRPIVAKGGISDAGALTAATLAVTGASTLTGNVAAGGTLTVGGKPVAAGTQAAHIADASTEHALAAVFSDTETEAALNALGTKLNAVIAALEAFGIAAPAEEG